MPNGKLKKFSILVDDNTYLALMNIAEVRGSNLAEVSRDLIKKGLAKEYVDESKDLIAELIRTEVKNAIAPGIERLAALSSKTGNMAATATFLNVQAFMDLVPLENRKEPVEMYEKARKMAINYMRSKTTEFDEIINAQDQD